MDIVVRVGKSSAWTSVRMQQKRSNIILVKNVVILSQNDVNNVATTLEADK